MHTTSMILHGPTYWHALYYQGVDEPPWYYTIYLYISEI